MRRRTNEKPPRQSHGAVVRNLSKGSTAFEPAKCRPQKAVNGASTSIWALVARVGSRCTRYREWSKNSEFVCVGLRRVAEFFRPGPGGLRRTRVGINRCSRHRRLRLAARPDWRGLFEARFG